MRFEHSFTTGKDGRSLSSRFLDCDNSTSWSSPSKDSGMFEATSRHEHRERYNSVCTSLETHEESRCSSSSTSSRARTIWHRITCCASCCCYNNSRYSLGSQLFLSFGGVSVVCIGFIIAAAVTTTLHAAHKTKQTGYDNGNRYYEARIPQLARQASQAFTEKLNTIDGSLLILREATKDRFRGYPNAQGYANDTLTPFFDTITQQYKYPLAKRPLPIEWELYTNKTKRAGSSSSQTTIFRFPGACDPAESDSSSPVYLQDCRAELNDLRLDSGPRSSLEDIYQKASQYGAPFLKALQEWHEDDAMSIGIHFLHDGSGASLVYPGRFLNGTQTIEENDGDCSWLLQSNPMQQNVSILIGNESVLEKCVGWNNVKVRSIRLYNPVETAWFRDQALNPQMMQITGPYRSPQTNAFVLTFGRSIYDDLTGQLIGTVSMDMPVERLLTILDQYRTLSAISSALVRWDDGEVTAVSSSREKFRIGDTIDNFPELGIDADLFKDFKNKILNDPHGGYSSQETGAPLVTMHPVPTPPKVCDADYKPRYLIVISIYGETPEDHISLAETYERIDDEVESLLSQIWIVCGVGVVVICILTFLMSVLMTLPLLWINKVGDSVLESFGSPIKMKQAMTIPWFCRYAPRNEIKDLVFEFDQMIKKFSGRGTAKIFKRQLFEVKNPFTLQQEFKRLYESREATMEGDSLNGHTLSRLGGRPFSPLFGQVELPIKDLKGQDTQEPVDPLDPPHNFHHSIREAGSRSFRSLDESVGYTPTPKSTKHRHGILKSPFFWWVVVMITIPLLVTLVVVTAFISWSISTSFATHAEAVKDYHVSSERVGQIINAQLRSLFISEVLSAVSRDLYIFNRFAGWILFGALSTSGAYPELYTASDACKENLPEMGCPVVDVGVCDCSWSDPWTDSCQQYPFSDGSSSSSRMTQRVFFEGLNDDIHSNGDRNSTSYPDIATSPRTTSFYENATSVPGFDRDHPEGIETTYDRLFGLAALSVVQIPLYNYGNGWKGERMRPRGVEIGFEADGMIGGYRGCDDSHAFSASFQSNSINRASVLNPEVCPEGKYGLDARCTDWFVNVKAREFASDEDFPLSISEPFELMKSTPKGFAVSLPLTHPVTGELVAATKADLPLDRISHVLGPNGTYVAEEGAMLLVWSDDYSPPSSSSEVIIGPHGDSEGYLSSMEDFLFEDHDLCENIFEYGEGCERRNAFGDILARIRSSKSGNMGFVRSIDGGSLRKTTVGFIPVVVDTLKIADPSDFDAGVRRFEQFPFSVVIVQTDYGLGLSFTAQEEQVRKSAQTSFLVMMSIVIVSLVVVLFVSSQVTVSVTVPVSSLLEMIKKINRLEMRDDLPEVHGGSLEVRRVQLTVERLFMLVRFATAAFFSGEVEKAYTMLNDALGLFTKLGNKKAIGIANNNLGNTMLTMYRTMKKTGSKKMCGMSLEEVMQKGHRYFKEAIDAGEEAIERINQEEGFTENYLIFMQQLSNRYFNRAVFLLTVKDDHPDPSTTERQGKMDLATSKDMDREVVDNGDREGFKGDKAVHFELLMSRIKGLLLLVKMGYEDEWGLEDLYADAQKELVHSDVWHSKQSLFGGTESTSQLQRLDYALIDYFNHIASSAAKDDAQRAEASVTGSGLSVEEAKTMAARVAIRMLVEDDYLIGEAGRVALQALIDYVSMEGERLIGNAASDIKSELFQYRHHISEVLLLQYAKNDTLSRETYLFSNMGDVSMEGF